MNHSEHVDIYVNGFNTIKLYTDRIELGVFSLSSYRYEEIKTAKFKNSLFQMTLTLELWNGSKSNSVCVLYKAAKECQPKLEQFIRSTQLTSLDADGVSVNCTLLGGSGVTSLVTGNVCLVVFCKDVVNVISYKHRFNIKLNQLTALKLEGPGRVTTNTGVMGGGFGIEGALLGVGAATLLNALTQNTTVNTILYLAWPDAELFLHTSDYSPDEARMALSHAFTAIQSFKNDGVLDLASQLDRLAMLRNSGALTEEEYSLGKAKLLGSN